MRPAALSPHFLRPADAPRVALSADSTAGWFRSRHEERENRESLESLRSSFSPDARARPLARTTSDDMARGSLTTNWRIGGRSWKAPGKRRLVAHASRWIGQSTDQPVVGNAGIGPPWYYMGPPTQS